MEQKLNTKMNVLESLAWTRQFTHNPEDPTSNNFIFLFSLKEIIESDL